VDVSLLDDDRYRRIICYPRYEEGDFENKMMELKQLGVEKLQFSGTCRINGISVLGKGCVGIVIIGCKKGGPVAVKILRADANRSNLSQEALMLKAANAIGVGPALLGNSRRILLMRYVEGIMIHKWVEQNMPVDVVEIKEVLRRVVHDCFKMDQLGLDHGQLTRGTKHIIVEKGPRATILDFESASLERRPANVTSACQYLFLSTSLGDSVRELVRASAKRQIIEALKHYKNNHAIGSLTRLMQACGLGPGNPG